MCALVSEQRGMTLAEIMIAVAIIGIGLVALSSAIPLAAYGIQEGNQLSTATFLANQRMEQVRNAQWQGAPGCPATPPAADKIGVSPSANAAPTSCGTVTFRDENPDENPMAAPYTAYTRTVRITSCTAGCSGINDAGLRQVTVTVSYRPMTGIGVAAAGTTKSAVITMYIAQR